MNITVVIAAYNAQPFIAKAIESALAQTCAPHEIIVVDDGSTDGTSDEVMKFGDAVRYIRQQNSGVSGACNRGATEATGEVLAFLDADDLWKRDKLERQAELLSSRADIALVYTRAEWVDLRTGASGSTYLTSNPTPHDILRMRIFPRSSVAIRAAVYAELGGFDEQLRSAEDWDLWMRISLRYPMVGIDEALIVTQMHGSNLSCARDRMRDLTLRVLRRYQYIHGSSCRECQAAVKSTRRYIIDEWYLNIRREAKMRLRSGHLGQALWLNYVALAGNPYALWTMPRNIIRRVSRRTTFYSNC